MAKQAAFSVFISIIISIIIFNEIWNSPHSMTAEWIIRTDDNEIVEFFDWNVRWPIGIESAIDTNLFVEYENRTQYQKH